MPVNIALKTLKSNSQTDQRVKKNMQYLQTGFCWWYHMRYLSKNIVGVEGTSTLFLNKKLVAKEWAGKPATKSLKMNDS